MFVGGTFITCAAFLYFADKRKIGLAGLAFICGMFVSTLAISFCIVAPYVDFGTTIEKE